MDEKQKGSILLLAVQFSHPAATYWIYISICLLYVVLGKLLGRRLFL